MAVVGDPRRRSTRRIADLSDSTLRLAVEQHHEESTEAHRRLRETARDQQVTIDRLEDQLAALGVRMTAAEAAAKLPVNVEKVTFSGKQLAAIVGTCIVMAGAMWQIHVGVNDVRTAVENAAKIQDERTLTQKEAMDQLRAGLEMRRVEIQNLSNFVQQQLGVKR